MSRILILEVQWHTRSIYGSLVVVGWFLRAPTVPKCALYIDIPTGIEKPGKIRFYDENGELSVGEDEDFETGQSPYADPEPEGGLGLYETGNRGTKLGLNM